jgi:hypothetical protein
MNPDPNQNNNQSSVPQNNTTNQSSSNQSSQSIVPELGNETPMSIEPITELTTKPVTSQPEVEPFQSQAPTPSSIESKIPESIFTNTINPSALDTTENSANLGTLKAQPETQIFEKNEYKPQTTSFLSQPSLNTSKVTQPLSDIATSSIAPNPINKTITQNTEITEKSNAVEMPIVNKSILDQSPASVNFNPVENLFKTPNPEVNPATTATTATTTPAHTSITETTRTSNKGPNIFSSVNKQTFILLGAGILGVLIVGVGILLISNLSQTSQKTELIIPQENLVRETELTPTPNVSKTSNQDYIIKSAEVSSAIKQITTNYPVNLNNQNLDKESIRIAANQIISQDEKLRLLDISSAETAVLNTTITSDLKEFANLHDEIYLTLTQNQQVTLQKRNELQARYNNLKLKIENNFTKVSQEVR